MKKALILVFVLLIAGCVLPKSRDTGQDIKSLPEFQDFFSKNPDTAFSSAFWPAGTITQKEKAECAKLSDGDYWRSMAKAAETSLVVWTDEKFRVLCSFEDKPLVEIFTTTTTLPLSVISRGFGKIVPASWELTDDGNFKVKIENNGNEDIKMLKLEVDGSVRSITQGLIGQGGSVEYEAINVKPGLAPGSSYSFTLSIFYEFKSLPGVQLESKGTLDGTIKSVQKGKLIEISSVNCYNGDIIVSNIGTSNIKVGDIRITAGDIVTTNGQEIKTNSAVKITLAVDLRGKPVALESPANKVTHQC